MRAAASPERKKRERCRSKRINAGLKGMLAKPLLTSFTWDFLHSTGQTGHVAIAPYKGIWNIKQGEKESQVAVGLP